MPRSRDDILALLSGKRLNRLPVFSVLPSLTAAGIKSIGARYSELHINAEKMADAAASTFELFGFESAVVPFDLCVEAEALGCRVDFQTDVDAFLTPTIQLPITHYTFDLPDDTARAGRIPLVADAIKRLKQKNARDVAMGAWIAGPFTLAWQLFGADAWLTMVGQGRAQEIVNRLSDWLVVIGNYYKDAGADFITVHEMGGSPQIIGPEKFRTLVKPALQKLLARLPSPNVLSVCGDTNAIVHDLAACRAGALNVDHRNDLARTRQLLGANAILLGNLDPVGVLSRGTLDDVERTVEKIARAGANAVVPGCDLYPDIPDENMHALIDAARRMTVAM